MAAEEFSQEEIKIVANLESIIKDTNIIARNYINILSDIKEIKQQLGKNILDIHQRLDDIEKKINNEKE
jgi:hypothetical protein